MEGIASATLYPLATVLRVEWRFLAEFDLCATRPKSWD